MVNPISEELRRIFGKQKRLESSAANNLLALIEVARTEVRHRLSDYDPASGSAFALRQVDASLQDATKRLQEAATGALAQDMEKAAQLGIDVADVALPRILVHVRFSLPFEQLNTLHQYHASLIQDITDDLKNSISKQVKIGILAGTPTADISKAIGASGLKPIGPFKTAKARAETIARTEINRVGNLAAHARMEDASKYISGTLQKMWLSAADNRVRPDHIEASGQVVDWHDDFYVGGYPGAYPLDPKLPASESVNCRCRMIPVVQGPKHSK